MSSFSIIIPIFNEAENIQNLVQEIFKNLQNKYKFEVVIVDDASTDNTEDVLKELKKNFELYIIKNNKNFGQSYSIHKGIENSKYDIIVTIDGDGQNNPIDIIDLIRNYNSNNEIKLIGGIRYIRKDSFIKIFTSKIANIARQYILKDDCLDTGCSLKAFDKKIFLKFPYFNGMHRFLPALFKGCGYKTLFINVDHRKRIRGSSKYGTFDRFFRGIRDIIKVKSIIKGYKTSND